MLQNNWISSKTLLHFQSETETETETETKLLTYSGIGGQCW